MKALYVLLGVLAVGLVLYWMTRPSEEPPSPSSPPISDLQPSDPQSPGESLPEPLPADAPSQSPDSEQASADGTKVEDTETPNYPLLDPQFMETYVGQEWQRQGVTEEDIRKATDRIREEGGDELAVKDPGLVAQYLPARNIQPVYIDEVNLPTQLSAGAETPFLIQATYPDPSFLFERWDVVVDGDVVVLTPVGSKSADIVPAVIVPVELEGALPALDAGEYTIRIVGLGEDIEHSVTVQ